MAKAMDMLAQPKTGYAGTWNDGKMLYTTNPSKQACSVSQWPSPCWRDVPRNSFKKCSVSVKLTNWLNISTSRTAMQIFTLALNNTGRHFFPPERVYQCQCDYMLQYLKLDSTQMVCDFAACLRELNSYLLYFPSNKKQILQLLSQWLNALIVRYVLTSQIPMINANTRFAHLWVTQVVSKDNPHLVPALWQ